MTPYNLVNLSAIMGMEAIALTDHNSCQNCGAAMRAGEQAGITVIPGMELCTCEEVHVVCLFEELKAAEEFSDFDDGAYSLSPAAVAKTLCSLDFISGVNILVEGEPALGMDGTPIGVIMESDVVDVTLSGDTKKATVTLYFANDSISELL